MNRPQVVIYTPPNRAEPARIGEVVGADRSFRTVRWADGEEETISIRGPYRLADRGSLRHESLAEPGRTAAAFAENPMRVVERLLREQNQPRNATWLKGELEQYGIAADAVAKAWTGVQRSIKNNDHVKIDQKKHTYQWVGPTDLSTAQKDAQQAATETEAATATEPAAYPDPVTARQPEPAPVPEAAEPERDSESAPAPPSVRQSPGGALERAIAGLVRDPEPASLATYLAKPLATGARLGRVAPATVVAFVEGLTERDRARLAGVLAAVPHRLEVLDAVVPAGHRGAVAAEVLSSAGAEIDDSSHVTEVQARCAAWLLLRCVAWVIPSESMALFPLLRVLTRSREPIAVEAIENALRLLTAAAPVWTADDHLSTVAAAAARLPLREEGVRSDLLAALAAHRPETLVEERWWANATDQAIVDFYTSTLSEIASSAEVVKRIVAPRVSAALATARTRGQLLPLLSLPDAAVSALPPDLVGAALRRVGGVDTALRSWVEVLSGAAEIATLHHDIERERAQVAAARDEVVGLSHRVAELTARCARLEDQLRHDHAESVGLRAAKDRQLQIDVVRAMAELAAEVEELAYNDTPTDVLVDRVRALAGAYRLEPVEQVNRSVIFDPKRHELIGGSPVAGTTVLVIRPGYWWRSGGDETLLCKAIVTEP